jgi:hypothetical protein
MLIILYTLGSYFERGSKMKRKRLHGILHAHYEHLENLSPVFQDEHYIERDFHFGYCRKCGKPTGEKPIGLRLHILNKDGKRVDECPDNDHEEYVGSRFDFKGMYTLQVGDRLTVFSKKHPSQELWSGVITSSLPRSAVDYDEPDLDECVPAGIPKNKWFKWFSEEYPATFLPRLRYPRQ